ncbi:2-phosphosulfolactate phosphatase [Paenibacillus athensensis]|uniref:Probable 2-phosphosulfolactate phosphatase n=1 Tax=Paenibacillus athensensis TaxID=1967502 RepID=A0A4Y8Q1C0_9BACL|nr:2-phosphosulfolactate phosphatase [Paenibacillus athensensis]MCD1260673.1 2-phosphosulfolactate phosphatase [Paenibacillus athensensis]
MNIDVIGSIGEARSDELLHKTVIVIDVLRATTTMVAALANGATGVLPAETVLQAREQQTGAEVLGGERYCKKIPDFDLGNSPADYTAQAVGGRRVILTTTNGTRGIHKAQKAEHVLAGALVNATSCAAAAVSLKRDVVIICAGTQDVFALEDGLCAGLLVDSLLATARSSDATPNVNDFGLAMRACYLQERHRLLDALLGCANGKRLCKLGFRSDVDFCAQVDSTALVPMLRSHVMVPFTAPQF